MGQSLSSSGTRKDKGSKAGNSSACLQERKNTNVPAAL